MGEVEGDEGGFLGGMVERTGQAGELVVAQACVEELWAAEDWGGVCEAVG